MHTSLTNSLTDPSRTDLVSGFLNLPESMICVLQHHTINVMVSLQRIVSKSQGTPSLLRCSPVSHNSQVQSVNPAHSFTHVTWLLGKEEPGVSEHSTLTISTVRSFLRSLEVKLFSDNAKARARTCDFPPTSKVSRSKNSDYQILKDTSNLYSLKYQHLTFLHTD